MKWGDYLCQDERLPIRNKDQQSDTDRHADQQIAGPHRAAVVQTVETKRRRLVGSHLLTSPLHSPALDNRYLAVQNTSRPISTTKNLLAGHEDGPCPSWPLHTNPLTTVDRMRLVERRPTRLLFSFFLRSVPLFPRRFVTRSLKKGSV